MTMGSPKIHVYSLLASLKHISAVSRLVPVYTDMVYVGVRAEFRIAFAYL